MPGFGDFYNKSKKKASKGEMAKKANKSTSSWTVPQPQVIGKGKKER